MEALLEKIKERISDRNSPIRTVKSVAEAIGMSEAGFYRMVNRGTIKYGTLLALSKALEVDASYFTGTTEIVDSKDGINDTDDNTFGKQVLSRILDEMTLLREQLNIKDRQLESKDAQIVGLHRMLESVLGKSEDDANEPTLGHEAAFANAKRAMVRLGLSMVNAPYAFRAQTPLTTE